MRSFLSRSAVTLGALISTLAGFCLFATISAFIAVGGTEMIAASLLVASAMTFGIVIWRCGHGLMKRDTPRRSEILSVSGKALALRHGVRTFLVVMALLLPLVAYAAHGSAILSLHLLAAVSVSLMTGYIAFVRSDRIRSASTIMKDADSYPRVRYLGPRRVEPLAPWESYEDPVPASRRWWEGEQAATKTSILVFIISFSGFILSRSSPHLPVRTGIYISLLVIWMHLSSSGIIREHLMTSLRTGLPCWQREKDGDSRGDPEWYAHIPEDKIAKMLAANALAGAFVMSIGGILLFVAYWGMAT